MEPWGGTNNFVRTLHNMISECNDFEIVKNIHSDYDILFMNDLGMGPANGSRTLSINIIKKIKYGNKKDKNRKKIVVRVVNIKRHAYKFGPRSYLLSMLKDWNTIKLSNIADFVIFQSEYQKSFFKKYGYRGMHNIVIHNGADERFWSDQERPEIDKGRIRIVSATAAYRKSKRHDLIARFSEIPDIEMIHLGRWPEDVEKKNVIMKGVLDLYKMKEIYSKAHYFLHPAEKDPCPNVIFEAILSGMPIIYNPKRGSSEEIVKENGLPLNEQNLYETFKNAMDNYYIYTRSVKQTKQYYSIRRAADLYMNIFKDIAKEC